MENKQPVTNRASHQKSSTSESVLGAVTPDLLRHFHRQMLLIRRFEERAGQLYSMGHISGFCHLYIGQEAVAVGTYAAMNPQDTMVTAYRDHGHMLVAGMDPRGVMAELTGRRDGCSKGKGGSMHMFSREKNFFGGHGIVGGQVPLGTGIGFAHQYKEDGGVCLVFMGDGASNQGQVYESFNMASLWKLPVLFVIENNHYAMGTSVERACAGEGLWRRGEGFAIPGKRVDGKDVLAVREATFAALERARAGEGPSLLEFDTYRYRGHSMSDPAQYRSRDEVEDRKKHADPIEHCLGLMRDYGISEEDIQGCEKEIKELIAEVVTFAQNAPLPDESELWTDVLIEETAQ
jgi:pyruvate dehydrogenase E1 component alpha subunit